MWVLQGRDEMPANVAAVTPAEAAAVRRSEPPRYANAAYVGDRSRLVLEPSSTEQLETDSLETGPQPEGAGAVPRCDNTPTCFVCGRPVVRLLTEAVIETHRLHPLMLNKVGGEGSWKHRALQRLM